MPRQHHRLGELLLVVSISLLACKSSTHDAESAPAPKAPAQKADGKPAPAQPSAAATTHAKQAIDTIVAGIKSGNSTATAALFDHGAVALAGAGHEVDEPDLIKTLGRIGPHDIVTDVKVEKLVVGGNDDAAWSFADLKITKRNQEPGEKPTTATTSVHTTELLTAATGWKIVGAAFSESRAAGRLGGVFPMLETTSAGPLTALIASPAKIEAALSADPNVVVVANESEVAVGASDAKKLLSTWEKRSLSVNGSAREVRNAKWGIVQANVDWNEPGGKPYRFSAQLIALPQPDGSWSVVAVQFLAL
jgi:hypothetical protein